MSANGCDIENGEAKRVGATRNGLARFQTVEYLRAFLFGRLGWWRLNSLMIISGAFSLFRRTGLVKVGGYRTDTVREDMGLVGYLRRQASRGQASRIAFQIVSGSSPRLPRVPFGAPAVARCHSRTSGGGPEGRR
jgi:hypothetical protein